MYPDCLRFLTELDGIRAATRTCVTQKCPISRMIVERRVRLSCGRGSNSGMEDLSVLHHRAFSVPGANRLLETTLGWRWGGRDRSGMMLVGEGVSVECAWGQSGWEAGLVMVRGGKMVKRTDRADGRLHKMSERIRCDWSITRSHSHVV